MPNARVHRTHSLLVVAAFTAWALLGCSPHGTNQSVAAIEPVAPPCDVASATPWITKWFDAWELASRDILKLPNAPAPNMVFYDSACVYTTAVATMPGVTPVDGPALRGQPLRWSAAAHDDSVTFPDGMRAPVALMSFANSDKKTGAYFVMAAPSYWDQKGHGADVTPVFLHEFTHTRQLKGMAAVIGPIDSTWAYPEELTDDAVQTHFSADSVYVAAYLAECDLLYRAAATDSLAEARSLAEQALAMMKDRQARWFTGDKTVFTTIDNTFLCMEGAAQWTAYAWLSHPKGGGIDHEEAVAKMIGRRRWWTQDEGLALFLVVDRLYPEWPRLVFGERSPGATELLERAIRGR